MPRARQRQQPVRLQDSLVLFHFMLSQFGCRELTTLSRDLKDPILEGIDDEGVSRLCNALRNHLYTNQGITTEQLFEYDRHIVKFTREINERRAEKVQWKYFQYLSLLFTEVYLDRYFSDRTRLLNDINTFLRDDFNFRSNTWKGMPDFTEDDLKKLAFWCATGSGKTLMMHVNIKQYLYYAEKYKAKKLNRILILTPNEGLSRQHLDELTASNFHAELFSKQGRGGMFAGTNIEVIDINKLADTDGDKTVAVESFEGNNLVLVDEGHRGSGGEVWKGYRNTLTAEGFSFEYSATFGQAIAAQTGTSRNALLEEYGKATLFDYSYRYFYDDGYGKDYRIMNMESWDHEENFKMYLTAYLLSLYEQTLVYQSDTRVRNRFLIAKPLGIFVGSTVNAVHRKNGQQVSDVVSILLFLKDFIEHPHVYTNYIHRLFSPDGGIKNAAGYSLFANAFTLAKAGRTPKNEEIFARKTYEQLLQTLFHAQTGGAHLYLDKQSGTNGEIGLRVGSAEYFGVINVGDSDALIRLCSDYGIDCESKEFGKTSLFTGINNEDSPVNILIGSKKFSEGWSSWRVSVMGLMNVGRTEGSEIIQLFGRGVRLKGFQYSLKRSSKLDSSFNTDYLPQGIREIETLNIFGVNADYMNTFRDFLKNEGLPSNDETYVVVEIPTVNLLGDTKLKVVRVKEGYDFKKEVTVHPEDMVDEISVTVDWRPKVEVELSEGATIARAARIPTGKLDERHLALLDWTQIFFDMEQMKNERSWYNMELSVDALKQLMLTPHWYELRIQPEDLEFRDFGRDVRRWQEITIALLRAFIDKAYKRNKGRWESQYMEVVYINPGDANFFDKYTVEVRNDQQQWIEQLKKLREQILSKTLESEFYIYDNWIRALHFDRHLYYPLLCLREKDDNGNKYLLDKDTNEPLIKISPVALNVGETRFVEKIRDYYDKHKDNILQGKDIYLLRNESRKGIGFFEANNFYPDFILWINDGAKQYVTFIDPKGITHQKGLEDPKITLFKLLKEEIGPTLKDSDIVLDSYIISNTNYQLVKFWGTPVQFLDKHVLFEEDADYLDKMFNSILAG